MPVIGPVTTASAGTCLGAGFVTWMETTSLERFARVGLGVSLARTVAIAVKVTTAVVVTGAVALALFI